MHPALFHLKLFVTSCCLCLDEPQTRSPAPLMATHCSLPPGLSFHVILWRDFPTSQSELALPGSSLSQPLSSHPTAVLCYRMFSSSDLNHQARLSETQEMFRRLRSSSGMWRGLLQRRACLGIARFQSPLFFVTPQIWGGYRGGKWGENGIKFE